VANNGRQRGPGYARRDDAANTRDTVQSENRSEQVGYSLTKTGNKTTVLALEDNIS
jgi:hypothetical protein